MDLTAHDIELMDEELETPDSSLATLDEVAESADFWDQFEALKNPYLSDPDFIKKKVKKEAPLHRAAFLYWCQLQASRRTDIAVAKNYKVSAAMVGKWRRSFNWEARLELLTKEDAERQIATAKRTLADDLTIILAAGKAAIDLFVDRVASREIDISPRDFVLISQEIRSIRRELAGETDGGETGSALDKMTRAVKSIGDDGKDVLIKALEIQIGGGGLPHDGAVEAHAARIIQGQIETDEIGEEIDFEEIEQDG